MNVILLYIISCITLAFFTISGLLVILIFYDGVKALREQIKQGYVDCYDHKGFKKRLYKSEHKVLFYLEIIRVLCVAVFILASGGFTALVGPIMVTPISAEILDVKKTVIWTIWSMLFVAYLIVFRIIQIKGGKKTFILITEEGVNLGKYYFGPWKTAPRNCMTLLPRKELFFTWNSIEEIALVHDVLPSPRVVIKDSKQKYYAKLVSEIEAKDITERIKKYKKKKK
jgi:hypothetical protein